MQKRTKVPGVPSGPIAFALALPGTACDSPVPPPAGSATAALARALVGLAPVADDH